MKKLKLKTKRLQLKTKQEKPAGRDKLDLFLEKARLELKNKKPVEEGVWLDIKTRLPDDTDEKILAYYPNRSSKYDLLPSFLILQHYIYETCCLGIPSAVTKWMKFKRV